MVRRLSHLSLSLIAAVLALAQTPAEFDVASIKPNVSGVTSSSGVGTGRGRLTATNVTLRRLIQSAYDVNDFQIVGGPGWLGTDRYDVDAKVDVSAATGHVDYGPMQQALLADRFRLKIHRETKEQSVYSLVLAKTGPKLTEHTGPEGATTNSAHGSGKASLNATRVTIPGLADRLGRELGRAVIDNTGLKGEYDVKLEWIPDQAADSSGPSIFTAIQEQLGLKLETAKGPVEVIVVDGAEKASAN